MQCFASEESSSPCTALEENNMMIKARRELKLARQCLSHKALTLDLHKASGIFAQSTACSYISDLRACTHNSPITHARLYFG